MSRYEYRFESHTEYARSDHFSLLRERRWRLKFRQKLMVAKMPKSATGITQISFMSNSINFYGRLNGKPQSCRTLC